jgi:ribosomal-protein-alanine N-acetyltransferase
MDEICRASAADTDALFALGEEGGFHHWSYHQFADAVARDNTWIMRRDGALAGFAIFSRILDEAELHNVVVSPQMRQGGIGRKLLLHGLDDCRKAGAVHCLLEVGVTNLPAIGLYEKLGFCAIAVRKNYYTNEQGGEDALVMQMPLHPCRESV